MYPGNKEEARNPFGLLAMAEIKPLAAIQEKWTKVDHIPHCAWFTIVARTLRKAVMKYLPTKVRYNTKRPLRS